MKVKFPVSPEQASGWALVTFVLVLLSLTVIGASTGSLLAGGAAPATQTTSVEKTTTTTDPSASPPTTVTVHERTDTTTQLTPDLFGRLVDGPAFWVLRLGLIVVAAFVAAAVVQRVLLGHYEVKLGPIEVPSITGDQVRKAAKPVKAASSKRPGLVARETPASLLSATDDPSLKLVALRIEIEGRIRTLLAKVGLPETGGLTQWIGDLARHGTIEDAVAGSLLVLVDLGNQAAHGVAVDPSAGLWADEDGPAVLAYLDDLNRHPA